MNKQLKELAKQAGFDFDDYYDSVTQEQLERFVEFVRQDERKSCAKILDAFAKDMENKEWTMGAAAMRGAADTIRFKQISDETEGEK